MIAEEQRAKASKQHKRKHPQERRVVTKSQVYRAGLFHVTTLGADAQADAALHDARFHGDACASALRSLQVACRCNAPAARCDTAACTRDD